MKIGILETGAPPESLQGAFGRYTTMLERLLDGRGWTFETFDVQQGRYPSEVEDFHAYLITGSPAGVYEDHAWIPPLIDWLRVAKGRAALVGVCFGHQVMAQAFGGEVRKSEKGWGVGLHAYEILSREPWMDEGPARFAVPVSHQDQVIAVPPHAATIAGSSFCAHAALVYRDQPAISFQGHPEFEPAYAAALVESRRGTRFSPTLADEAVASLNGANDRERVGGWIARFIESAAPARARQAPCLETSV